MFLYMWDNVLRRSGKCCATVRGMFLCGEDFVDEAGGVMHNRFFLIPHVNILQLEDNMAKLRIKYFGPITEGFDSEDVFIDFSKSTLSIGDQGTGETTVGKKCPFCSKEH